jgi:muramoyltetrapeptide carboxypeptidase
MPQDFEPIVPGPLGNGARVAVIAPAGPCDRALVLRGLGWLSEHYRVEFDSGIFEREGYLAGSDARRLAELDRALADPGLGAIVAARGGYGLTRIAEQADWAALRRHPKWLVGFSDATVLHVEALRTGVASLHAANAGGLGQGDARARERFCRALEEPVAPRLLDGLECLHPGRGLGPLVGGNLSLLVASATAGRLRFPLGSIVLLEDVTETAYRVDRLLTSLIASGALDGASGVVLGDFTDCPPSAGVSVRDVLVERLGGLRIPVLAGLRFGHGEWNEPLVLGPRAAIDAAAGTLTLNAERT